MRNLKRALSLALATVMTLGLMVVGTGAVGYDDVTSEDNQEAIEVLQQVGIMTGDENGNFNPDSSVTRNEMAVIMSQLLNLDYDYYRGINAFTDVPSWAAPYVAACVAEGVTAGIGDGLYGGSNNVTAAQAALMLMKALGYFQYQGDFNPDWQVATIRQASYINLFDGVDANAEQALTRSQVAQMVLNALKSDMVYFTGTVGTELTLPDGTKYTAGYVSEYSSRTSSDRQYNTLVGGKTDIAEQGQYYIQLGEELYDGKLTMRADTDAFQRPATTWAYKSDTIGTYVDYDLMVAEYTTAVAGSDLYADVGKTAFDQYDFYGYVNGEESALCDEIAKNNDQDVSNTAKGALTQVFVNNDAEEVVVTVVNTYLAQATADYNEKKDTASFKIYNLDGKDAVETASGEDFDVADVLADEFYLVTFADDEIQTISDVEIISDTEISKFSTSGSKVSAVTVDGTKYDASAKLGYDMDVLDEYTSAGGKTNLKDTTYNVYLDAYGYAIGVDIVEGVDNYVFITGADDAASNLSTKTWEANAIFMDGTSEVIEVKNNGAVDNDAIINKWFTYTVSSSGVYTLTKVAETAVIDVDGADDAAQRHNTEGDFDKDSSGDYVIDSKHISMKGNGADARIYGNDDTIYLLAELDKVSVGSDKYAVIKGVDEVVVGIDNASFTVWGWADAKDDVDGADIPDNNENISFGAYPLYGDDGYIIAAVVVGDSSSVSSNVAYVISSNVKDESYDKTTGEWTWTREVIINGELVELVETNDTGVSELENDGSVMGQGKWIMVLPMRRLT